MFFLCVACNCFVLLILLVCLRLFAAHSFVLVLLPCHQYMYTLRISFLVSVVLMIYVVAVFNNSEHKGVSLGHFILT